MPFSVECELVLYLVSMEVFTKRLFASRPESLMRGPIDENNLTSLDTLLRLVDDIQMSSTCCPCPSSEKVTTLLNQSIGSAMLISTHRLKKNNGIDPYLQVAVSRKRLPWVCTMFRGFIINL